MSLQGGLLSRAHCTAARVRAGLVVRAFLLWLCGLFVGCSHVALGLCRGVVGLPPLPTALEPCSCLQACGPWFFGGGGHVCGVGVAVLATPHSAQVLGVCCCVGWWVRMCGASVHTPCCQRGSRWCKRALGGLSCVSG